MSEVGRDGFFGGGDGGEITGMLLVSSPRNPIPPPSAPKNPHRQKALFSKGLGSTRAKRVTTKAMCVAPSPSDESTSIVGSTSMANRLVNPLTRVGSFENFWSKASDRLWAGSVEIMSTDFLSRDISS
jgi:hypothetical protein